MPRWAAKKDTTQKPAERLMLAHGYSVVDSSRAGHDFPDMIVAKHKITITVEMKTKGKKPSDGQVAWAQRWKGHHVLAYSAEEALEKCEAIIHGQGGWKRITI